MGFNSRFLGIRDGEVAVSLRDLVPMLYDKDSPLGDDIAMAKGIDLVAALGKYRSENDCARCRNTMATHLMRMDASILVPAVEHAMAISGREVRRLVMPRSLVGEWVTITDTHAEYKEVFRIIAEYGFSSKGTFISLRPLLAQVKVL